jgi:membrane protease YdiL (CAAX protease family)
MSNPEPSNPRVGPRPTRTWGFWETAFFGAIAYGVFMLAWLSLAVLVPEAQATQGRWQGAGLIIGTPPAIAVLWVAIREARRGFAEYLALNWPSPGEFVRALPVAAIYFLACIMIASGGPEGPSYDPLLSVRGAGGLFILLVGGCIAAPMMEEFVFRGFMFRGWSESFLGPIGAIVLTSALWGMSHTQYDWGGRFMIFILGLSLGYLRWRSDSTWLTVMIHSVINISLFFTIGPYT